MILRRFMKHIKEQNWFAVGLDVVVVIVGIFLGLQVQAWYEIQQAQEKEQIYLTRMQSELEVSIPRLENRLERRQSSLDAMHSLITLVSKNNGSDEITAEQCSTLAQYAYFNPSLDTPAVNELLETGQLVLILNDHVRSLVVNYSMFLGVWNEIITDMRPGRTEFDDEYPEIIAADLAAPRVVLQGNESPQNRTYVCNLQLMRKNQKFKNNLAEASNRFGALVGLMAYQVELLNELAEVVNEELS